MLTIKLMNDYGDDGFNALVSAYGREYALHRYGPTTKIVRTNGSSYERLPKWKVKADWKMMNEFADWYENGPRD